MVGTIMIASTIHALKAPNPSVPENSATIARKRMMPKKP